MWAHDLNRLCKNKQNIKNIDLVNIVSQAGLGKYIGSVIANIYIDKLSDYNSLEYNDALCLLIFTTNGLLCMYINKYSGLYSTTYTFTAINGFIPAGHIINYNINYKKSYGINLFRETPILNIITQKGTYTFMYDLTKYTKYHRPTLNIKNLLQKYKVNSTNIITEGNFLDLKDDPSFAGIESHIVSLKRIYKNNTDYKNDQIVRIKANYTPNFQSSIFNDSIHTPKYFLVSFTSTSILLFKLSTYHTDKLFLTGDIMNIPRASLINEALYNPSPNKKWSILVTSTFIITLFPVKRLHMAYSNLPYAHALTHYISNQDPVLIPKLSYHLFIRQQYKKIAQKYKSNQSLWQRIQSYISMNGIILALRIIGCTLMGLIFIWPTWPFTLFLIHNVYTSSQPLGISILNILISLIMFCLCFGTWNAYFHTQSINSKLAWIVTILSIIILIYIISSYTV